MRACDRATVGTAMGAPPACALVNLCKCIHEISFAFFRWLVDDCIGPWIFHEDPAEDERLWLQFQEDLKFGMLEWKFTKRQHSVNFLDVQLAVAN